MTLFIESRMDMQSCRDLPEIKLKRTDTTLDLSQKAKLQGY